jgi:hypothetical protein
MASFCKVRVGSRLDSPWLKVVLSTVDTTKLKMLTMSTQTKHEHSPSCLSVESISQHSIPKLCILLNIDSILYYHASTDSIPDDTTGVTPANLLTPELPDFLIPPCKSRDNIGRCCLPSDRHS